MRGSTYIVISSSLNPTKELGEALSESMSVCSNFRKAYDLALSMGNLKDPNVGYKGALVRCNKEKAIIIGDRAGSNQITIVQVKKW